jgi:hypothetical protein
MLVSLRIFDFKFLDCSETLNLEPFDKTQGRLRDF